MARATKVLTLEDRAGNKYANAKGTLYTDEAATVLVTDNYTAASGGTLRNYVISDAAGQARVYMTTPKSFWVKWDDNGGAAYPAGEPGNTIPWSTFVSKEHQAFQSASDEATDDADLDALLALGLGASGSYAQMIALASPVHRRQFYVEEHQKLYEYDGFESRWKWLGADHGVFYVDDYGATAVAANATPTVDAYDAFEAALVAAGQLGYYGKVVVGLGRYLVGDPLNWTTLGLSDARIQLVGTAGYGSSYGPMSTISFSSSAGFEILPFAGAVQMDTLRVEALGVALDLQSAQHWGAYRRCQFATVSSTVPAVNLGQAFTQNFELCSFNADTASEATVEITDEQAWYHRFKLCDFGEAGVRHTISTAHSTVTGEGIVLEDCFTENFVGKPIYKIECDAAVTTSVKGPSLIRCNHADESGVCDILSISAVAGATLTVSGGLIDDCRVGGSAQHLRTAGPGTVNVPSMRLAVGESPKIAHGASGTLRATNTQGLYATYANVASAGVLNGWVIGDSTPRYSMLTDGTEYFGGTGTGFLHATRNVGNGTPEGVVTANVGSTFHRLDGGAGTSFYVKETGTGNTGWVAVAGAAFATDQTAVDGWDLAVGTSTGTKIGTATSQKLGFFNTTPAAQPAGTTDVLASLVTLGLRAASSNPPLNLGTGALTAGNATHVAAGTTTTSIGSTTSVGGGGEAALYLMDTTSTQRAVVKWNNAADYRMQVGTVGGTHVALMTNGTDRLRLSTVAVTFTEAFDITLGTTTGTKIGTATSQKLGLWNATPIVQPTTAVAAATFVANTSGIANDTATFDGYTIGQVVKALRNIGALA